MTNEELIGGLTALGITSGYVIYGNDLDSAIWTNENPKPSETEIKKAYKEAQATKTATKNALLAKLGLTADELIALLS